MHKLHDFSPHPRVPMFHIFPVLLCSNPTGFVIIILPPKSPIRLSQPSKVQKEEMIGASSNEAALFKKDNKLNHTIGRSLSVSSC